LPTGAFALKFQSWCNKSISLEAWDGTFDAQGRPHFAAPVSLSCRIDSRVRMVRDMQGNDRASNTTVYVLGGPIDPHDRITLPADFKGPRQPPIINVGNFDDISEFSHSEIYL
jgi:hypothetical protein